MENIVLATSNPNKLREINEIANPLGVYFESVPQEGFNPIENGRTFEENAFIKAFEAARLTGKIALADDTGLCVAALNGNPGLFSARYAPTQDEKISKLLEEMKDVPQERRNAFFICAMIAVTPQGKILNKSIGKIEGFIGTSPKGQKGFGYDPIFFIPEENRTMAELTEEEKNTFSHRAKALLPMLEYLKNLDLTSHVN